MLMQADKVIYSKRKTIAIQVSSIGEVIVRAPKGTSDFTINKFLSKNKKWLENNIGKAIKNKSRSEEMDLSPEQIKEYKKQAKKVFKLRLDEISQKTEINYKKLKLSSAKKRWGSCSAKGNINVNWRLLLTEDSLIDYVLLHELTHIKHLNHSKRFWKFVEKHDPDYKKKRKRLQDYEFLFLID
jgi:predicted metal-dependent hydrolase